MATSFSDDAIDGFKAFVLTGGSRDQVVREISEYIYTQCSWQSNYERSLLLDSILYLVYEN